MEDSPSRLGLVVGALVVGGIIGFFIGRGGTGTTNPPTHTPVPTATGSPTPVPFATLCLTPGPQVIEVGANGVPACLDARIAANKKDTVVWKTTPGYYLWIRFPETGVFPKITCGASECNSDLPADGHGNTNAMTPTPYYYYVNVLRKGETTPKPGTPTPTPQALNGRVIIIKP